MTKPTQETLREANATGWTDDRLMEAYDLIWKAIGDHSEIRPEGNAVMRAIEDIDKILEEGSRK